MWHVQVQQIIAEQDAGLTQLGHSVRLLGDMGKDISVELGQQQHIIDEFDTELNVVTGRFSQAQDFTGHAAHFDSADGDVFEKQMS
jgi:hypothetical protein